MLTDRLRIVLAVALGGYFYGLVQLLKRKKLELKYTLLWMIAGILLGVLIIFPNLLDVACGVVGIAAPVNGLFMVLLGLSFCLILALTTIASKQKSDIKTLTQTLAILEERLRRLEGEKAK